MAGIFDRLNAEIDQIGDRVRTVFESSKLHLDRSRLVGLRSKAAYKLGMLIYKKERGAEINQGELDAIFAQLDDISGKIATIDRELDEVQGESISVDEHPAPPADTAEAEVSKPASTTALRRRAGDLGEHHRAAAGHQVPCRQERPPRQR